jgi:hypothetical protein
MVQREQQYEYNRGYLDALRNRGYNDGAVNTQGYLIDFRLTAVNLWPQTNRVIRQSTLPE